MNTTYQALFPNDYSARLMYAASLDSHRDRIEQIDAITDELSRLGFCRPRSDESRSGEWLAMRNRVGQPA